MSGYANTNYGPPPMGQTNFVNGLPATQQQQQTTQGVAGAPPPPFSANPQHQIQQQQQQILQQKQPQQQQLLSQPVHTLQSNMSKFLPPTSNSASSAALNGPTRPPTAATTQVPASNLPPHMRPPGMNVPPLGMPLTNGGSGSGDLSANSSRTASPSLAQQAQFGGYNAKPSMSQAPSGNVTPSNPQYSSASAAALSGSMQNLSINRINGASPANIPPPTNMQQQRQPSTASNQTQQQQTPFPSNYQVRRNNLLT